jgi:hypothetical protein
VHYHKITANNTKVNRILIHWMIDTCIKYGIPFDIKENGGDGEQHIIFSYKNTRIFHISKNVNRIRKRLAEKRM